MSDLSQLAVVVTGANGNLGTAVCVRLLAGGARVFGLVRKDESRAPFESSLLSRAGAAARERLATGTVELSDEVSVEAAYAAAENRFGPLWASVSVAGGWQGGKPLAETSVPTFEAMIDANLRSAFLAARAAVRRLAPQKRGRIVTVAAATAALGVGTAGSSAYAASKAGVIALTRALAEECARLGICASCVAPGTMRTPQNESAMPGADQGRWVRVEEVAEAIAFLCSVGSSGVNGVVIVAR